MLKTPQGCGRPNVERGKFIHSIKQLVFWVFLTNDLEKRGRKKVNCYKLRETYQSNEICDPCSGSDLKWTDTNKHS